jgi:hypothetical protein
LDPTPTKKKKKRFARRRNKQPVVVSPTPVSLPAGVELGSQIVSLVQISGAQEYTPESSQSQDPFSHLNLRIEMDVVEDDASQPALQGPQPQGPAQVQIVQQAQAQPVPQATAPVQVVIVNPNVPVPIRFVVGMIYWRGKTNSPESRTSL